MVHGITIRPSRSWHWPAPSERPRFPDIHYRHEHDFDTAIIKPYPLTCSAVRRLLCLLLLICLPLQSYASQIAGLRSLELAGLAHEIERTEELHHHHDDDGSTHYDDSDASLTHAEEHSTPVQLTLLKPADWLFNLSQDSLADYPDPAWQLPDPCLDGPQRPPSFAPGLAAGG